jgi:hypothetical protein
MLRSIVISIPELRGTFVKIYIISKKADPSCVGHSHISRFVGKLVVLPIGLL